MKDFIDQIKVVFNITSVDFSSCSIGLHSGQRVELPLYDVEAKHNEALRSVVFFNASPNGAAAALIYNQQEIVLCPGECVRALFSGEECVYVMENNWCSTTEKMTLKRESDGSTSVVFSDGMSIRKAIYVYADKHGYVVLTDIADKCCKASHPRVSSHALCVGLQKEHPLYIQLNSSGRQAIILTQSRRLYQYMSNNDKISLVAENVMFAEYDKNDEIKLIKC